MKKCVFFVFAVVLTAGFWSCGNSTKNGGEATDSVCVDTCCTDQLADSMLQGAARGDGEAFDADAEATTAGSGENKPCHVSGCSCKFGYAGNWDKNKCNKCDHSMSSHY